MILSPKEKKIKMKRNRIDLPILLRCLYKKAHKVAGEVQACMFITLIL